ncbi:MAG: hypothetical protein Q4A25_01305 [Candidatus Saccharibacteria bacterium]|nr:hypothetical protein [Candidatus Saccharibacteria bacterium]
MTEIDKIVKSNGIIRELFKDFFGSSKFGETVTLMRDKKIPVGTIRYGDHRVVIEDYYQSHGSKTQDEQEIIADEHGKHFHVSIILDDNNKTAISAHRIVHPDWWTINDQPKDTAYLVAHGWVYAENFYDDRQLLEDTTREILENLDTGSLVPCKVVYQS